MSRIRAALPEDADALGAILQSWLDQTPWMPDLHTLAGTQGFVGRLITQEEVLVAEDALGFLSRAGEDINALYVADGQRGRGVGSALIQAAQARSPRLTLWTFQANTGAQTFYQRHGFVETARTAGDNEEGLPDIAMAWTAQTGEAP